MSLTRDIEQEAAAWAQVDDLTNRSQAAAAALEDHVGIRARDGEFDPISFQDAVSALRARSYDSELPTIVAEIKPSNFIVAFFKFLFGPPKLSSSLLSDRDVLFCVAKVPLDHSDVISERMLQTIYMRLTGASLPASAHCSRSFLLGSDRFMPSRGPHWDAIGFGDDPATDLRAGILGLLTLLYMCTRHRDIALDISKLSRH